MEVQDVYTERANETRAVAAVKRIQRVIAQQPEASTIALVHQSPRANPYHPSQSRVVRVRVGQNDPDSIQGFKFPTAPEVVGAAVQARGVTKPAESFCKKVSTYQTPRPNEIPPDVVYPSEHKGVCPLKVPSHILAFEERFLKELSSRCQVWEPRWCLLGMLYTPRRQFGNVIGKQSAILPSRVEITQPVESRPE